MTFEVQVFSRGPWSRRREGELSATITRDTLIAELPKFYLQYRHRLLIGGEIVAEAEPEE